MYNFDPYNVLLAIATNIAVLLMDGFVLQSHICVTFSFGFSFVFIDFKFASHCFLSDSLVVMVSTYVLIYHHSY